MNACFRILFFCGICNWTVAFAEDMATGELVDFYGYENCIRLQNATTSVTLCPAAGGRILEYALEGKNALYLPTGNEGWTWDGKNKAKLNAGRFDIGPEKTTPRHPTLFFGRWTGKILGPLSAELTSAKDEATGVQLVRRFELAKNSSKLLCKQTIKNISDATKEYCHWSRTFAVGEGICVIPTSKSRFPKQYVMYQDSAIQFLPNDPNIYLDGDYLIVAGQPAHPKLGMDSAAGWFAYLVPSNLMFVKHFPVHRDRVYSEMAGLTISIWYPSDPKVELEPIGPSERLEPGQSASFTEIWELFPFEFPTDRRKLEPSVVADVALKSSSEARQQN